MKPATAWDAEARMMNLMFHVLHTDMETVNPNEKAQLVHDIEFILRFVPYSQWPPLLLNHPLFKLVDWNKVLNNSIFETPKAKPVRQLSSPEPVIEISREQLTLDKSILEAIIQKNMCDVGVDWYNPSLAIKHFSVLLNQFEVNCQGPKETIITDPSGSGYCVKLRITN